MGAESESNCSGIAGSSLLDNVGEEVDVEIKNKKTKQKPIDYLRNPPVLKKNSNMYVFLVLFHVYLMNFKRKINGNDSKDFNKKQSLQIVFSVCFYFPIYHKNNNQSIRNTTT